MFMSDISILLYGCVHRFMYLSAISGLNGLSDSYDANMMIGNTIDDTHHDGSNPALVLYVVNNNTLLLYSFVNTIVRISL